MQKKGGCGNHNASQTLIEHEFNFSISSIQELNGNLSSAEEEELPKHMMETPAFSQGVLPSKQRTIAAAQHQYVPITTIPAMLVQK